MSRRLERLLQLSYLLRHQPGLTIGLLAEKLEVSERTVFYDIAFLRDRYTAPIITKNGAYYLEDSNWNMPDSGLTESEIFTLLLGKKLLESYFNGVFREELQSAACSLLSRLPKSTREKLLCLSEFYVHSVKPKICLDTEVLKQLHRAIMEKTKLRIQYRHQQTTREYSLIPCLIYICKDAVCLIAYCDGENKLASFKIHRIVSATLTNTPFHSDKLIPEAQNYIQDLFCHEGIHPAIPVKIYFDPVIAPDVREALWHTQQELFEFTDGSVVLSLKTSNLQEIKAWVLMWGPHARILEPSSLVDEMRRDIQSLQKLYPERG